MQVEGSFVFNLCSVSILFSKLSCCTHRAFGSVAAAIAKSFGDSISISHVPP